MIYLKGLLVTVVNSSLWVISCFIKPNSVAQLLGICCLCLFKVGATKYEWVITHSDK